MSNLYGLRAREIQSAYGVCHRYFNVFLYAVEAPVLLVVQWDHGTVGSVTPSGKIQSPRTSAQSSMTMTTAVADSAKWHNEIEILRMSSNSATAVVQWRGRERGTDQLAQLW